jgi:hypothetical protein
MLRTCLHFLLCKQKVQACSKRHSVSPWTNLTLNGEHDIKFAHALDIVLLSQAFSQRDREIERERERGRERKWEGERDKERERRREKERESEKEGERQREREM